MLRTFVDCEGPVKTWCRNNATITALAGSRIYLGTPSGATQPGPWITLWLVNDMPEPFGQMPLAHALFQFDCWAPKETHTRADAAALGAALVTAAESLVPGTLLDPTLRCHAAEVQRWQWLPDPANDLPRYSLDIEFLVCATGA